VLEPDSVIEGAGYPRGHGPDRKTGWGSRIPMGFPSDHTSNMTPAYVSSRVQKIADLAKTDAEAAHSVEDDLMLAVLHHVSLGHPQSVELAREALRVTSIDYPRWCA